MSAALHQPFVGHLDLDGHVFLAGALLASAAAQAEQAFVEVRGGTPEEVAAHVEARGLALMDLWADLMARTGQDREGWAREAGLRAVRAYAGRLGELMAGSAEGGRG